MIALNFGTVAGLTEPEQKALDELVRVYSLHQAGNAEKEKYYEGHVALKDVNLGIALPQGIRNLEIGCSWGQKAVDVLAARSMFDGFVSSSGDNAVLNRLIADNRLIAEYGKACRDELKYGCAFATLSADAAIGCKIRFHSPATAAALWSGEKGRIACGLAIIDTVPDEHLQAARLDDDVVEAMAELATLTGVGACRLVRDYNFTDTANRRYRYQAVFEIVYY